MDEDGFCQFASVGNIAQAAIVTREEAAEAIRVLESSDPDSSDPEFDGRRIQRVPGGWMVLNSAKYRALAKREQVKEQTRERVRKFRLGDGLVTPGNAPVTLCNGDETLGNEIVTPSEAEAYTEEESQKLSSNSVRPDSPVPSNGNGKANLVLLDALTAVWEYYCLQTKRNRLLYAFTTKRRDVGMRRLKECLDKTDGETDRAAGLMMAAIDGLTRSDFHMGRDPKTNGKKYCDWHDHLFKSYEQMEKWWNA